MNPSKEALKDIVEYLKNDKKLRQNESYGQNGYDVYIVGLNQLYTSETVKLNRELGIYSINKLGNTNFKKQIVYLYST